jgi:DNA-binding MarR family transcriptional regulator
MLELAEFLGLEKSTMSGLVERAEARGLLLRERNPEDGRAVDVFLSSSGAELGRRIHAEVRRALAPETERLDQAERKALTALLEGMLDPGAP